MEQVRQALQEVRVLDLGRYIAAPYCALLLADMGAEVIKVESPGGERTRDIRPFVKGESLYFLALNRNKKGVTLNLRSDEGKAILRGLIKQADVLVQNYRPSIMEAMGFSDGALQELNPRLVTVAVSGFGQDGPFAQRPAYDAIAQAMSGLMSLTGYPDGPPTVTGAFIADFMAGTCGALGALLALYNREKTGKGQAVDVSLLESLIPVLLSAIPEFLLTGNLPNRVGNRDRHSAPVNIFQTKDGYIYIESGADRMFARLAQAMGTPELTDDPRFKTRQARLNSIDEIEAIVKQWVETQTVAEVTEALDGAMVPYAPVRTVADLPQCPQLRAREQIVEVEHPIAGNIPMSGVTIKLSATPGSIRMPPPLVGQHNEEIYGTLLGYGPEKLEQLKEQGII